MSQESSTGVVNKMKAMMLPRFGGVDQFRQEVIVRDI